MTSLTHAGGRGEPVEVPRAHSTEGRYDMIAPRGEGRRRHLAASLTLSSLSNVILLLLLCMALSTAAPITASGTGLGRGHWISRSHRDAASAGDQQWEPNDWSRSIDGGDKLDIWHKNLWCMFHLHFQIQSRCRYKAAKRQSD